MLAIHTATRYVVPLREGGSLPAVLDTEEGGLFVAKFRGAGQGAKALIAEILVAQLATALELPVPEVVLVLLDEAFGRSERDPEIQDILQESRGVNVGMRYLDGAFNFDPVADRVDGDLAARIVWLDALVSNLDRTARNPNLMLWQDRVWLIDHGAALYFHHNWTGLDAQRIGDPFAAIADHVLLAAARELERTDDEAAARLDEEVLASAVAAVPDELLMDAPAGTRPPFASAEENRDAYRRYLSTRLAAPRSFAETAVRSRREAVTAGKGRRQGYRR